MNRPIDPNSMSMRHLTNMRPHLEMIEDSPTWKLLFNDNSQIQFDLVVGKATPRAYGNPESFAEACRRDIASIDVTEEVCTVSFKDKSGMQFPLKQMPIKMTRHPKVFGNMPRLIVASEETWSSFALFDPNAYPQKCRTLADLCAGQAALIFFHVRQIQRVIQLDGIALTDLLSGRNGRRSPLEGYGGNAIQAEHDSIALTVAVNGALSALKSFLDTFAFLISKLLGTGKHMDFGKAKVKGDSLAGGCIINSLRRNCPASFKQGNQLADYIEAQSRAWIHRAVVLRDESLHAAGIKSLRKIRVLVERRPTDTVFGLTLLPVVIDETAIEEYFASVINNLRTFIQEVLRYFPDVTLEQLPGEKFGEYWIPKRPGEG